jgi:hypothetical protein
VTAIVAALLGIVAVFRWVIRPVCWSGIVVGCLLLFLLVRELLRTFDMEFCFDRAEGQLQVIKRPWLGRSQREYYPLQDITEVRVVEIPTGRHNYPGHDYDDVENDSPIDPGTCEIDLTMRSGSKLTVCWADGHGTKQLAASMAKFLGLPATTA